MLALYVVFCNTSSGFFVLFYFVLKVWLCVILVCVGLDVCAVCIACVCGLFTVCAPCIVVIRICVHRFS